MTDAVEKVEKLPTSEDAMKKNDSNTKKQKKSKKKKHKKRKDEKDAPSPEKKTDATKESDKADQMGESSIREKNEPAAIDTNRNDEDDAKINNNNDTEAEMKKRKKSKKKKNKQAESSSSVESAKKSGKPLSRETTETADKANDGDESDNSEDELLAAAAMWAGDDGEVEKDQQIETSASIITTPQNYSLHITQLPYDSTDFDLRKLFAEQGCSITSIRLVYDHDTEGRKTVFRGVAFCDFLNAPSYQKALKLHHKTSIRGRRLNIRPCKSKEELAAIVARTQDLVREKIHQQLSGKDTTTTSPTKAGFTKSKSKPSAKTTKPSTTPNNNNSSSSSKPPNITNNNNNSNRTLKRKNNNDQTDKKNKKPRVDKDGKAVKLTKKERNRRAAIIMQKRRRQK